MHSKADSTVVYAANSTMRQQVENSDAADKYTRSNAANLIDSAALHNTDLLCQKVKVLNTDFQR